VDDDNDPVTCRGRAAHARFAAEETSSPEFRLIFARLAKLYDEKAVKLEARERRGILLHSDQAHEFLPTT